MRKYLFALTLLAAPFIAMAEQYSSLAITTNNGRAVIAASGLEMTITDGNLIATAGSQTMTFKLTDLKSMEFSNDPTGIATVEATAETQVTVYGLDGISHGTYPDAMSAINTLTPGHYVFKYANGATSKVSVNK